MRDEPSRDYGSGWLLTNSDVMAVAALGTDKLVVVLAVILRTSVSLGFIFLVIAKKNETQWLIANALMVQARQAGHAGI